MKSRPSGISILSLLRWLPVSQPHPARLGASGSAARPCKAICIAGRLARVTLVKMIHNGIEYGLMAAYAEGLNILRHADAGERQREVDAETTPLREPEYYQFKFDLSPTSPRSGDAAA